SGHTTRRCARSAIGAAQPPRSYRTSDLDRRGAERHQLDQPRTWHCPALILTLSLILAVPASMAQEVVLATIEEAPQNREVKVLLTDGVVTGAKQVTESGEVAMSLTSSTTGPEAHWEMTDDPTQHADIA